MQPQVGGIVSDNTGYNSVVKGFDEHVADSFKKNFADAYPEDAVDKLWVQGTERPWFLEKRQALVDKIGRLRRSGRARLSGDRAGPHLMAVGATMADDLQFQGVVKRFGAFTAVRNLDLTIREGEFFSFLGPSGCGKTTILRMVSGFIEPTEGDIRLGAQSMRGIGPNKRPTALIFQNLALFPLMTVEQNIGFGLEVRGVPAAERRRRVTEMLELIALPGYADRRIDELSAGRSSGWRSPGHSPSSPRCSSSTSLCRPWT